jgi:hypothetical protein
MHILASKFQLRISNEEWEPVSETEKRKLPCIQKMSIGHVAKKMDVIVTARTHVDLVIICVYIS